MQLIKNYESGMRKKFQSDLFTQKVDCVRVAHDTCGIEGGELLIRVCLSKVSVTSGAEGAI